MTGFKNFVLKGNLVDMAVAFIVGVAFAKVVESFTAWLTGILPGAATKLFKGVELGDLGYFINQCIAFLILAAVVYFLVVLPYTKARDRYFPAEEEGTPADVALLEEIRDLLAARNA